MSCIRVPVCVFVCLCVRVYVCTCLHVYVFTCLRVYVCSCERVNVCTCVCTCVRVNVCMRVSMCVCVRVCLYIYMYSYIYICIHARRCSNVQHRLFEVTNTFFLSFQMIFFLHSLECKKEPISRVPGSGGFVFWRVGISRGNHKRSPRNADTCHDKR